MKIELLKKNLIACINWQFGDYDRDRFIELLEQAKKEWCKQQRENWINVKDKLPESDSWVLVYADGAMNCMVFSHGEWKDWIGAKYHNVNIELISHWMPLPKSPMI